MRANCFAINKNLNHIESKKGKNWNLFAGDLEYRTNFYLQFRSPFTFNRFQQDIFQRKRLPIKCSIWVLLILVLIIHYISEVRMTLYSYIGLSLHIPIHFYINAKYTPMYARSLWLIAEIIFQVDLLYNAQYSTIKILLLIFNIWTFIISFFFY